MRRACVSLFCRLAAWKAKTDPTQIRLSARGGTKKALYVNQAFETPLYSHKEPFYVAAWGLADMQCVYPYGKVVMSNIVGEGEEYQ